MTPHHEGEGFPRTETREIKTLISTRHPNMVKLIEVVTSLGSKFEGALSSSLTGVPPPSSAADVKPTEGGNAAGSDQAKEPQQQGISDARALGQTERSGNIYMVFEYVDYDLAGECACTWCTLSRKSCLTAPHRETCSMRVASMSDRPALFEDQGSLCAKTRTAFV